MIKSKLLSDFSNIAQGAFSTVNAIREELDVMVRSRIERVLTSKGLVTKEENDVIIARKDLVTLLKGSNRFEIFTPRS